MAATAIVSVIMTKIASAIDMRLSLYQSDKNQEKVDVGGIPSDHSFNE